jgi:hypothetical protein
MTPMPPSPFTDSGATDCPPDKAAAAPRQSADAAAFPFHGESNENLQNLQRDVAGRSIPFLSRLQEDDLQNLHKENASGGQENTQGGDPQQPRENACADTTPDGRASRSHSETGSLSSVSGDHTEACSGWSSRGLLEAPPSEVAMPQLPRRGAYELAPGSVEFVDLDQDCIGEIFVGARKLMDPDEHRFILDEQAFMDAIDEPPLFLRRA